MEAKDKALLLKSSLDIALVKETEQDKRIAGLMKYSVTECEHVESILRL